VFIKVEIGVLNSWPQPVFVFARMQGGWL